MPRKTMPFYKSEYLLKMYEADTGANGGGAAGAAGEGGTDAGPGEGGSTPPPATPPAVNLPTNQSEFDAAISRAIASHDKNKAAEYQKQIEDAKAEGAAYAKLSEKERLDADLAKREQAINDREAKIQREELSISIKTDLDEKKLPTDMAEALIEIGDPDKIKAAVVSIKKSVDEVVNAAVKERLRQDDPQTGASTGYSKTVNPYAKMRNEQATKKVDAPNPWGN